MPFTAITYDIKSGYENEIAEIFSTFTRVGSASVPDQDGQPVARILATALFIRDSTMVRFIEYEGDLESVARFMAAQRAVQEVERKLKPYLARPRNTDTVEGFVATFMSSTLRCISQLSIRDMATDPS